MNIIIDLIKLTSKLNRGLLYVRTNMKRTLKGFEKDVGPFTGKIISEIQVFLNRMSSFE